MDWLNENLLTAVIFFPLAWGALLLALPKGALKVTALLGSLLGFILSLVVYSKYQPMGPEYQLTESHSWIELFGITYSLGIDGISLWLMLLTTFLLPIVVLSSFEAVEKREREYYFLLFFLQTGMLGAFATLDVFLFYVFWEAMLIPMYLLIGIWGGKERIYASMKFFLYTLVGSLLMLVAIFYLNYQHSVQFGSNSTLLSELLKIKVPGAGMLSTQSLLFLAFALAFAIKVPLFPLHTWLPDAHVQAPTAGSVILAGVLLKLGGYGFIRFAFPMFPEAVAHYRGVFMILGSVAIVYGAWMALVQTDVKKLVAYSSVSHMGYVVLGLFSLNAIGVTGSVYQMLNHGISTGALFLLVGMIYERRHTREIKEYGGITKAMPMFAVIFMIATLSSVALPGTNGFVGEFLILLGSWQASHVLAIVAGTGVVFGAVYMLWMFQRVMFGKITNPENEKLSDLNLREKLVMLPLVVAIVVMGVFPRFFIESMAPSIERFIGKSNQAIEAKQVTQNAKLNSSSS